MKLQTKLTLFFITFSLFIVIPITMFIIYENKTVLLEQEKHNLEQVSKKVSHFIHNFLYSKIDTVLTISTTPILSDYLLKSNKEFEKLNNKDRTQEIIKLNNKWMSYKDDKSEYIQAYLTNKISKYLKLQQQIFKNRYGEIFVTNKYGALVSSTSKLTTFSHSNKYWWKGTYNNGSPKIYIDDRGFDKSVNGYVIGIVVPILHKEEIIGILKANLNIEGSISKIINGFKRHNTGSIELIRSKGLIVYKEGTEPLSQKIEPKLVKSISNYENSVQLIKEEIIAFSKIVLDHNIYDIVFSSRQKEMNQNNDKNSDAWYIFIRKDINEAYTYLNEIYEVIIIAISTFLLLSILLGRLLAHYITAPLERLLYSTKNISEGKLLSIIHNDSKDEIGQLSKSFNKMSKIISDNMDSKNKLLQKIDTLKNEYESTINETNLVSKTDPEGNITYVNNAFCTTLGYTREDLIGKNHRIHKNPDTQTLYFKNLWNTILSGETWTGITTNVSKNGKLLYLHTSIFPILDDNKNIIEFIAMRFNITNEVELRQDLQVHNKELLSVTNRLNIAQKISKIGSYEFDISTNNVIWSDGHFRLVDEEIQSFKPTLEIFLSYVHKDDLERVKQKLNESIYLREFRRFDFRVVLKSGEVKFAESTSDVTQYDENNKPLIVAGTILDITDRVNKEKEIEEKNKIMFHQSKMSTMGEMLGNIAHQWRQPLSIISTISTGIKLKKELNVLEEKELIKYMDDINSSVQYLSKTIDDFRNFFDPNKIEEEFSIKETFDKTFKLVSSQYKSKNIEIITSIKEIKICGFENELLQVLINILNNARDAFENIDLNNKYIFINTSIEDDLLIIKIRDNAGGISKTIINKVFEPYFTTKHQSQGTGIGLYMSKEIIEKHMYGTISVENQTYIFNNVEYTGAEFKITIDKYL